jgi:hypothetical protein
MSAPRLFPKGKDRSWTRAFYYAINRLLRREWYCNDCDRKLGQAMADSILYGQGWFKL